METFRLSDEQVKGFHEDGYVMVPDFFSGEAIELLVKIAKADRAMDKAGGPQDATGATTRLRLRNDIHQDIYGAFAASDRVVRNCEKLMGDEVYHYHHKMMLKEPRVGGAWEWHQDYGYWYNNGCLFPDMLSCYIAVDEAVKANGCLQVLKGSHHMGRIEHGVSGSQTGADMERVEAAMQRMELVYCEMKPGTALFFHSNLLHRSDQNRSDRPRWSLICCYNTKHNDPYKEASHPGYSPLEVWPDQRIIELGQAQWEALESASA